MIEGMNWEYKEFICEQCGSVYKLKKHPGKGRKLLCKECLYKAAKIRRRKAQYHKRPKYKANSRKWRLKTYYNMSISDYNSMLESQNGVCIICLNKNINKDLVVDHCHKTGKVRGLLCDKCNRALGSLQDDFLIVKKSFDYLTNFYFDLKFKSKTIDDNFNMKFAKLCSLMSPDPSTKVGSVIIDKYDNILSCGYNSFPNNIKITKERLQRPLKYSIIIHAEQNALLNLNKSQIKPYCIYIYCNPPFGMYAPCNECTKLIIQSKLGRVVLLKESKNKLTEDDKTRPWKEQMDLSVELLTESKIVIDYI